MIKRLIFKSIFLVLPLIILVCQSQATEFPMIPFHVSGKVVDWDTKEPLENVNLIIFLNDGIYTDNHGRVKDAQDFPHFPKSDQNGNFKGRTRLYRGSPKIEIIKIEIIAFREEYRTERFVIKNPEFTLSLDKLSGTIEIKTIELLKNHT